MWRKHAIAMVMLAATMIPSGCSPQSGGGDRRGDTTARAVDTAVARDTAQTFEPDADGTPMRTAREVVVRRDGEWLRADIPYDYSNVSDSALYLVNCNGDVSPGLQRRIGKGEWQNWWAPMMNACLSPPVVIESRARYSDTLFFTMGPQDGPLFGELQSERDAEYRLVWHQAVGSYDAEKYPFGAPVPLERRVSNSFRLRLP